MFELQGTRMDLKIVALAGGALLALSACASGRSGAGDRNEPIRALMSADALMFVSFDTNADLSTSADEIAAGVEREFARADANADGNLGAIEFQNWANVVLGGGQMGPYRLDFDRNVDNTISRAEFETEIRGRVTDYDQDQNGSLSRTEYVRLIGVTRPPRERPEPGGDSGGMPPRRRG
jgi:hypothetical protein